MGEQMFFLKNSFKFKLMDELDEDFAGNIILLLWPNPWKNESNVIGSYKKEK